MCLPLKNFNLPPEVYETELLLIFFSSRFEELSLGDITDFVVVVVDKADDDWASTLMSSNPFVVLLRLSLEAGKSPATFNVRLFWPLPFGEFLSCCCKGGRFSLARCCKCCCKKWYCPPPLLFDFGEFVLLWWLLPPLWLTVEVCCSRLCSCLSFCCCCCCCCDLAAGEGGCCCCLTWALTRLLPVSLTAAITQVFSLPSFLPKGSRWMDANILGCCCCCRWWL